MLGLQFTIPGILVSMQLFAVIVPVELKTFISIVETDNVIKVMENLNLSKATVYEHLKYLEQFFRVNIALISRNNEITITESGNLLYKRAKECQLQKSYTTVTVDLIEWSAAGQTTAKE